MYIYKLKHFFLLFLAANLQLFSDTSTEIFHKYLNRIFVETGSNNGNGIAKALDAGFQEIYSIELSKDLYETCTKRFVGHTNVHLYQGDSAKDLKKILSNINDEATFWLDSHYSGFYNSSAIGDINNPILEELAQIAEHHIKTHTLLIDDVRLFGTFIFDFIELDEVIDFIKTINPNYTFSYENGYEANDVLVAKIMEKK